MQDVRGRGDGVRAQEQGASTFFGGHNQTPGGGGVAVDVGVNARARVAGLDAIGADRGVDIVAVVISRTEYQGVGIVYGGLLGKFILEEFQCAVQGTVEQPAHQAKRQDVAAFQYALGIQACLGQGCLGHGGHGYFHHLGCDTQFLEGAVGGKHCLLEVRLLERVNVNDDYASGFQKFVILLERGRVHGHQYIASVARGVYTCADTDLEAGHAAQRALRGADFGWIVRESGHLVAQSGGDIGKDVSGQLHAVTGVTGETDYNLVQFFDIGFL